MYVVQSGYKQIKNSCFLGALLEIAEREVVECPYCAIENIAGNAPLFRSKSLREVQLYIIFKHPGLDFEEIEGQT